MPQALPAVGGASESRDPRSQAHVLERLRRVVEEVTRLEAQGYADAARWVHAQSRRERSAYLLDLQEVREIHRRAVRSAWSVYPPARLHPAEGPGEFRRSEMEGWEHQRNPPAREVPALMEHWLARVNRPATWLHSGETMDRLAELHAEFERIHPFRNGNGRTGRLIVELLLLRLGYSRMILREEEREEYYDGLRRADEGDAGPLAALLERAVERATPAPLTAAALLERAALV